ncbi:MAG TPA: guanylate kinase [Candidatus Magasanikbacteria bacterium]|nr:MAG: guanylate kinase [Candidatus Magasanikbacteria bacterium RIFOXYC2_FULL_39_8]HAT03478.1 guanylate kinase [Candidatus Magasanikbacteria bacterium]HIH46706.1 guanylate kinase [Candidatus Woesearchaeota archaeon]
MKLYHPLVVICGPAGVGKTTVVKSLLKIFDELKSSITFTTREKRHKSTEDKIMHYVSMKEFEERRDRGEFLEWANVHGDLYGTHRTETEKLLKDYPVVFNIDVQGAEQVKKMYKDQVITIFLVPESHEQMVDHIKNRGEMSKGSFRQRLKSAEHELAKQDEFDYKIVNKEGELNETIEKIVSILEEKTVLRGGLDK